MPGGDRTGPAGMGPMTGRAAGYCAGYSVPGYMNPVPGRGRLGFGRGGFFRGGGRGRAWGRGWGFPGIGYGVPTPYYYPAPGQPFYPQSVPEDEVNFLKEHISLLEENIKTAKQRIKELENQKSKKE